MGNPLQTWRTGPLGAITAIGLACALSPQAAHAGDQGQILRIVNARETIAYNQRLTPTPFASR